MDRICDHTYDEDDLNPRYRTPRYNYPPVEKTCKPMENIPWSNVMRYHRRRQLLLPTNLDDALVSIVADAHTA